MSDIVAKHMWASAGIAAGSPFDTSELKAVLAGMARAIQHANQCPRHVNISVDNFAVVVHGKTREVVAEELVEAYRHMVSELKKLKLPIAADTTECVDSDGKLRSLIKQTIPCQDGPNQSRQLGADLIFDVGRRRKT
jgi:hypothetical protein